MITLEVKSISKTCHTYRKEFSDDDVKIYCKIWYHCRYTGKYKGVAHNICNLIPESLKQVPVNFHNGSNYHNQRV